MVRSIKPKNNNYIDSIGIMHNKKILKQLLSQLLISTELYSNKGGTVDDITLSDDASNYEYLEVFYGADGKYNSVKIDKPDNKQFSTFHSHISDNGAGTMYLYETNCTISGNQITQTYARNNYINNNSNGTYGTTKYVRIYRVIGYKKIG